MQNVQDFIRWALTHVEKSTIPKGAELPLPLEECGTEPWHYLFGSVRVQTNRPTLDAYKRMYVSRGWDAAQFDDVTADWKPTDYASDCQGILDAYLTYECGKKTDINANYNYTSWCTKTGKISAINRPWVIGEAVFMRNNNGRMTHVGWICGFVKGEPLVLEARGFLFGVGVWKLSNRRFTHRGLMTKKFSYESEVNEMVVFKVTNPMQKGTAFEIMQKALNAAGYKDANGKTLTVDGKWGKNSQAAFERMLKAHEVAQAQTHEVALQIDGKEVYTCRM